MNSFVAGSPNSAFYRLLANTSGEKMWERKRSPHTLSLYNNVLGAVNGASRWIRTTDTTIFNRVLYQLSYRGIRVTLAIETASDYRKRAYGEAARAWQGAK